jgi:hypothetical protein
MRATNEESYSDNDGTVANDASNDEDTYRIHLSERISDEFEHLINEERACRAKGRDDPVQTNKETILRHQPIGPCRTSTLSVASIYFHILNR